MSEDAISGAARTSGTALVRSSVLAEVYSALGALPNAFSNVMDQVQSWIVLLQ